MEENENNNNNNTFKSVNNPTVKKKVGFTKGVFVPFISGVVGASLVVGACFRNSRN